MRGISAQHSWWSVAAYACSLRGGKLQNEHNPPLSPQLETPWPHLSVPVSQDKCPLLASSWLQARVGHWHRSALAPSNKGIPQPSAHLSHLRAEKVGCSDCSYFIGSLMLGICHYTTVTWNIYARSLLARNSAAEHTRPTCVERRSLSSAQGQRIKHQPTEPITGQSVRPIHFPSSSASPWTGVLFLHMLLTAVKAGLAWSTYFPSCKSARMLMPYGHFWGNSLDVKHKAAYWFTKLKILRQKKVCFWGAWKGNSFSNFYERESFLQVSDLCLAWLNFFPPILVHFCPLFLRIGHTLSHFAQMGFHFAQNTTPNPCSLLCLCRSLSGICTYTKHLQPIQKHPFAWPDFESVQNELKSGQSGPQLGKMFEKCFLELGNFLYSLSSCLSHSNSDNYSLEVTLEKIWLCLRHCRHRWTQAGPGDNHIGCNCDIVVILLQCIK